MHPAWEELISSYKSDNNVLIASAQCQHLYPTSHAGPAWDGTGASLCQREHTQFFPHLMYGDPDNLQEYNGPHDFASLKAFVEKHKGNSNASPPEDAHEGTCPVGGPS